MALAHLLRERLGSASAASSVTLAARTVGAGDAKSLLISIVYSPDDDESSMEDPTEPEPRLVLDLVRELGGDIHTTADPLTGRTTAIRLNLAPS
jgi:hypothetical protein